MTAKLSSSSSFVNMPEASGSAVSLPKSAKSITARRSIFRRKSQAALDTPTSKPVLLTLKLSSPSFLDSMVQDDLTKLPLYIIDTNGTSTSVSRTDPWQNMHKVADIKWPKLVPIKSKGTDSNGVLVQIKGGPWITGEELLQQGSTLSGTQYKFNIPGYSRFLKWKKVGKTYWCTTGAVQGPIAIFYPSEGIKPAKLVFYESLHDKHDTRPLMSHRGVSTILTDYLLVTSAILVTDIQEWMVVKKYEGPLKTISPPLATADSASDSGAQTTSEQWRKIAFGEPMFPKKRTPSSVSRSSEEEPPLTPSSNVPFSQTTPSSSKGASGRTSPSSSVSSFHATPEEADEQDDTVRRPFVPRLRVPAATSDIPGYFPIRIPSPSAESVFFPLTPSSAPSHTYIDPSFYNGPPDAPPVPPLPLQFTSDRDSRITSASAPSSATGHQRFLRDLPTPPTMSPSRSESRASSSRRPNTSQGSWPSEPVSPTSSIRGRKLPTLPSSSRPDEVRRQPSTSTLHKKRQSSYSGRSLPPAPAGQPPDPQIPKTESSQWSSSRFTILERQSVFDMPPPAYNSIDFDTPSPSTAVQPNIPVPPLPSSSRSPLAAVYTTATSSAE